MYTTSVKFPVTPRAPSQLQADLRGMIARSSSLTNPSAIQVSYDEAKNAIVLSGQAVDEDQARLVENMIRLTPGVRAVENQLTVLRKSTVSQ